MENNIISVERILQYTSIPSEAPLVVETCRPDDLWPVDGKVDIHNLQVMDSASNYQFTVIKSSTNLVVCVLFRYGMPHTCHLCYEESHAVFMAAQRRES